jgi:hypothetical protein
MKAPKPDPRRRRTKVTTPAGDLIGSVLAGYHLTDEIRALRLVVEWRELVGERFAARTWPDGLSKRVLWVRVSNSAWMQELSFLKAQLVARIREALGEPTLVDDVRFHLGGRRPDDDDLLANAARDVRRRVPVRRRPLPAPASGEQLLRIEVEIKDIEDPDLRAVIRDIRRRLDL